MTDDDDDDGSGTDSDTHLLPPLLLSLSSTRARHSGCRARDKRLSVVVDDERVRERESSVLSTLAARDTGDTGTQGQRKRASDTASDKDRRLLRASGGGASKEAREEGREKAKEREKERC